MQRLAKFDVSATMVGPAQKRAAETAFGASCAVLFVIVRTAVDGVLPGAGPFALIYPVVMVATLYGHLTGGLTAFVASFLWAWYFVLPLPHSFALAEAQDAGRLIVNAAAALVIVIFSEAFRRAIANALGRLEAEVSFSNMLQGELEHRTKNNLAIVVSLLERQKRRSDSAETVTALDQAATRVRAFADAYTQLSYRKTKTGSIPVRPYLIGLLDKISAAAVPPHIKVSHAISDIELQAERAVALGLFMNEAITNTCKYAFPGRADGAIHIALAAAGTGWTFSIKDDGCGMAEAPGDASPGMGRGLMDAFAAQAGATLSIASSEAGTDMVLTAA